MRQPPGQWAPEPFPRTTRSVGIQTSPGMGEPVRVTLRDNGRNLKRQLLLRVTSTRNPNLAVHLCWRCGRWPPSSVPGARWSGDCHPGAPAVRNCRKPGTLRDILP
ncbi:hypothetical protein PPYR_01452 [Photinus pyralis]|uniref:Uncharacterized protein n=1 Tax=Photinus pyralis TaxID=7054 RepID=A0A5N4B4G5_PHOPY|nr:hypothetical protein PPYR_01452 [Photinus pyralis]